MKTITVTELNTYVKNLISYDGFLNSIIVKGEVSNFTNHIKTGHFYFSLKDSTGSIRAIMFKSNAVKVPFVVENGMNVVISGSVQVFVRDGVYQLYCNTLEPDGIGSLYLAFEQLKEKLSKKGLFDDSHKKPIPQLPKKIGIVTSKTGAALQDILNVLTRRYPLATAVIIDCLVQGENAPSSICRGIKYAQNYDIDTLIVGRGGGSIEDLWAFNNEQVAIAIYECRIPVICAVGHEVDFTIADFVADLRAATPTAAAELATPDIITIKQGVYSYEVALHNYIVMAVNLRYDRLKEYYSRLKNSSPTNKIITNAKSLSEHQKRLELAIAGILNHSEREYKTKIATLEALSPLKVLTRGYSITYNGDKVLNTVNDVSIGDILYTTVQDGKITSIVK